MIYNTPVRKPICPTFIHDEPTRMVICIVGIVICSYIIYKIIRYYNT